MIKNILAVVGGLTLTFVGAIMMHCATGTANFNVIEYGNRMIFALAI